METTKNFLVRIPYRCYNDAIMTSVYHIKGAKDEEDAIRRACDAMPYSNWWIGDSPAKDYLRAWNEHLKPGYNYSYEDLVPFVMEE